MNNMRNKILSLLVLLMTAASGAWAGVTPVSVAGNWLNPQWDATTNQMAYKDGVYSITFSNMPAGQNYEFKFALNNSWNESYGYSSTTAVELNKTLEIATQSGVDTNIKFDLAEACDVTISFNLTEPRTFMISTSGLVIGEDDKAPIKVAYNTAKTTASFDMPTSDVTIDYELVRDITQKVDVETRIDGTATERIRIAKDGDGHYQFVTKQEWGWQFAAVDKLENNKDLTNGELTYTFKMKEGNDYVAKNFDTDLCPGTWRLEAEANADKPYDGIAYGPDILLYDFKNISFAKGYTTHYYSESLVLDEVQTGLRFYAVTAVTAEKVTLTEIEGKAIPGGTPFIVYNETAEPITAVMGMLQADDVTSAEQFKGTAEDKKMDAQSGCYILRNGDSTPTFRLVEGAGTLPAHRCYIDLGAVAGTRSLGFDFGDGTTRIEELKNGRIEEGEYYDLQGRKHQGTPQRKGVYVKDGRKVIVR